MTELLNFMSANPFLTWCLAWGIWAPVYAIVQPIRYAYLAYSRTLRSRNIRERGWPTAPLMDADGDIVHPKKGDD